MSDGKAPRTRIEEIRQARGLKSAELARRIGADPSIIHRIETAKAGFSHNRARALARALLVPVEQLYAPIGTPIPFLGRARTPIEARPYHPDHALPEIGRRLRALLDDAGASAEEMAHRIGATEADMRDWTAGRAKPDMALMDRLADRAAVTLAWIYFGDPAGLLPGVAERLRARLARQAPPGD
jgi:transcriptional regulator with XRE-family HTH domain